MRGPWLRRRLLRRRPLRWRAAAATLALVAVILQRSKQSLGRSVAAAAAAAIASILLILLLLSLQLLPQLLALQLGVQGV